MTGLRRALYPLRVVGARLRRRSLAVLLTALGIATGAAVLGAVLAGSLIAQDKRVGRSVEQIEPAARAVRAVSFGTPGELAKRYPALDRDVRAALRPVLAAKPTALVLYKESTIAGQFVGLGAVDDLGRWVRITSGRLPRLCRPERCEVVRLRGEGAIPNAPGLRLVEVGEAVLTSSVLFGDFIAPVENRRDEAELSSTYQEEARWHEATPPPLVLANGVAGLVASPPLASVYRSFAWVLPLGPESVRVWDVDRFRASLTRARSRLELLSTSFDVQAPTEELAQAREDTQVGGRRLLLIGGESAALLFVFALLAATTMRRDSQAARERLELHGASGAQVGLATAAEAFALGVAGTAVGWALGVAATAILATAAGEPPGAVLTNSLLSAEGWAVAGCVALVAGLVVVAALRTRPLSLRGASISALDLVALAAVCLIAVALARGALDEEALAREGGTGWLLLVLPALVTLVVAIVAARLFPPLARWIERRSRSTLALRLAAVSLARNPGHAGVAIAFFVVSLGLALFAAGYRTTLAQGQTDQAAYEVPLDFVVREDLSRLIPVFDAAPVERFGELGDGVAVEPVLRASGSVSRFGTTGVAVLGIDPATIPQLDGLRDDFSSDSPAALAAAIEVPGDPALTGLELPEGATALVLPVEGRNTSVAVAIERRDGRFVQLNLGAATGEPGQVLRAPLPSEAAGGRIVSLRLVLPRRISTEPGSGTGQAVEETLTLGTLAAEVGGAEQALGTGFDGWIGVDGVTIEPSANGVVLRYSVAQELANRIRPVQPADGLAVPVIASPRLANAAAGGELPLRIAGVDVAVRVAAVARRFPGVEGDFVVADRAWLASALDTARPGAAVVNEAWIGTNGQAQEREVAAALAGPPFQVLDVTSRVALEDELHGDPLGRGTLVTLLAAAIVALVLALAGLVLVLVGDLRDERGQFLDLEAQGAGPGLLRRLTRLRAGLVAGVGLLGGLAGGAALCALVVRLVAVTAGSGNAEPPLRLTLDWPLVVGAIAAYGLVAFLIVGAVTAGAFRRRTS
jgi:hypothetical protein